MNKLCSRLAPAQAISAFAPVHVIPGILTDLGGVQRSSQPSPQSPCTHRGPYTPPTTCHLGVGLGAGARSSASGASGQPALAADSGRKHGSMAAGTLTCQPRLLPSLGSDLTPTEVLQALESRWTDQPG
ncbi:hypothetical protein ABBQ38_010426 [Trebouxia sp. C0009 RCD-2024]